MKLPKGWRALKPIHPNAGIRAEYQRRLDALIGDMVASYDYWIKAAYRANTPEMAQDEVRTKPSRVTAVQVNAGPGKTHRWTSYVDGRLMTSNGGPRLFKTQAAAENAGLKAGSWNAVLTKAVKFGDRFSLDVLTQLPIEATPAANLQEALDGLAIRWTERFSEAAPNLGTWFASSSLRTSDGLKKILRDGGVSVQFQMTPVMRDVFNATVAEQVGLIKSIGSQYHSQIQGMVMRSVTEGRDLGTLTKNLHQRYGITRRRAAFIALDQNNKASANFVRVRQEQFGLDAMWLHSAGGREPRPTHVANSGKTYDPKKGWWDPAVKRYIWPGTEPRCRCISRTIVKGFS